MQKLRAAAEAVREGGRIGAAMLRDARVVREKANEDIVTEGDLAVEKHVVERLRRMFPDDGIDSEEMGAERTGADDVWVLDPIDGTKYYARDVPLWTVSLGLRRGGAGVGGIVYSPPLDRMWFAAAGRGATLNGQPIRCSDQADLSAAFLCVQIPGASFPDDELDWAGRKLFDLVRRSLRVRVLGVGALDLCLCAAGAFDACINLGGPWKPCDVAAGWVIASEAGAEVIQLERRVVVAPPALCDPILDALGLQRP